MYRRHQSVREILGGLLLVSAVAGFFVVGCSEIHPEPNVEVGGPLASPTHEQDALRDDQAEEDRGSRR